MQTTRVNVTNLIARATGIVEGLSDVAKKEPTAAVSNEFAAEYNRLRSDVATAVPELRKHLPIEVNVPKTSDNDARYAEIFTYGQQIFRLLHAYRNEED